MSTTDLKRQLVALQKEFLGGTVGKMKKHELDQRLTVLKKAMELKASTPEEAPAKAGPPSARHVKTEIISIDGGETMLTKPVAPTGGKVHSARYSKKATIPDAAAPAAAPEAASDAASAAAPAASTKVIKKKITPPKVVLSEEVPVKKIVKKRVPKPAAAEPAAAEPAAAEPAPEASAAPLVTLHRLPGGVKSL